MKVNFIRDFVIKQRCLPWRVLNWLNYHIHPIYMLLMYLRLNINTLKYWEKRWREGQYNINSELISLYKQSATKIPPRSFVLDAGCGNGYFMELLKEIRDVKSFGIDFSFTAIQKLKAKGLNGVAASITEIPFNDSTFDVVTATEVLEHLNLKNSTKAIKEIRRVCKNCGCVIISVPTFKALTPQNESEHLRTYTAEDINDLLSDFLDEIVIEESENAIYLLVSGKVYK